LKLHITDVVSNNLLIRWNCTLFSLEFLKKTTTIIEDMDFEKKFKR